MPRSGRRQKKGELEEDQFVEWIVKAADFVKQRAQAFIIGVAAVAVLIFAFGYVKSSRAEAEKEAAALLGTALIEDESGRSAESMLAFERLIETYAGTPAAAQGTVILANRYFAQGRYAEAERLYRSYLDEDGSIDVLVFTARAGIAACYEAQGNLQRAASEYLAYVADNPGSMQASIALMDAARCQRLDGNRDARKELLQRIAREYPRSPVAARARDELNML